ncbi:MAG: C4-dicarboxylate ABC transporter, partial [Novosphingobium sp.]|nr:C4-dicarboxylate ABC transporter [Novosphingobium sp.]
MNARTIGFVAGLAMFAATLILPAPGGMAGQAWVVAGLVALMAAWWMTEAIPLTATALMPFLVLPFAGIMTAKETASSYYSPTLFLILGGAFLALA